MLKTHQAASPLSPDRLTETESAHECPADSCVHDLDREIDIDRRFFVSPFRKELTEAEIRRTWRNH